MNQTFLWGVDVIDVNLKFFVRDLLQNLFPGQLLPLLHFLFTLFLKVQSEPKKWENPLLILCMTVCCYDKLMMKAPIQWKMCLLLFPTFERLNHIIYKYIIWALIYTGGKKQVNYVTSYRPNLF